MVPAFDGDGELVDNLIGYLLLVHAIITLYKQCRKSSKNLYLHLILKDRHRANTKYSISTGSTSKIANPAPTVVVLL